MDDHALRNIKCDLAVSFVRTVAARCNFAFSEKGRSFDGIGIDCEISKFHIGNGPKVPSPGGIIHVQVKGVSRSSASMYKDSNDVFQYNQSKLVPIGVLFYLVVVELPEEDKLDEWVTMDGESLILKRRAYYTRLIDTHSSGFIHIPKTQQFTTETLPALFIENFDELN